MLSLFADVLIDVCLALPSSHFVAIQPSPGLKRCYFLLLTRHWQTQAADQLLFCRLTFRDFACPSQVLVDLSDLSLWIFPIRTHQKTVWTQKYFRTRCMKCQIVLFMIRKKENMLLAEFRNKACQNWHLWFSPVSCWLLSLLVLLTVFSFFFSYIPQKSAEN